MLSTAAYIERDLLLNDRATLYTFLDDWGAVLTRHHVKAGLEQNCGRVVSTDKAVPDDCSIVNVLLAEQTFLHSRRAAGADCDVSAGREENLSSLVRTDQTFVQEFLISETNHPVTPDDAGHGLA